MTAEQKEETAYFGDRVVPKAAKAQLVHGVFAKVAPRYDLMNDLMSIGIHRLWKSALIDWLNPRPPMRLLDVAGGTGDIAFRFLDRAPAAKGGRVDLLDINEDMIGVGRERAIDRGLLEGITFTVGDAESLPFADRSVDAYTIAFGIRNVTNIPVALAEARRVLRPGGRFLCLEFSHVAQPGLSSLYDLYSRAVLPGLGAIVAGDARPYRYLAESIRRFPDAKAFAAMIAAAGLGNIHVRRLSGGIVALHSAWRI